MSAAELPREFGGYALLKLLARGGMGEIYLARAAGITGFEKYYAVKKLLKKFTHDIDVGARFVDEAKLGARLQHPNIVQVYDLGKVQDELYMATEFVDGFDLRRVLRFCHEKKKRIPLDIALFIVREILSGLAYAHRQVDADGHSINLIHRDISPQNVLVSFEGEVKIIDFGLAKSTQRSQETQANVLLGNFGYMSPEQARGHPLDVRTDAYSAGIVLFELVTGTKRFVEDNPLRLLELVARPTPIVPSDRVPQTPKAIDRLYTKATMHNRDERYDTAEAFRDDVTTALHRINPKASRENLAQFLNHLFLGGQAPLSLDADILDRSVAVRARDFHDASDAFQKAADADLQDRSLREFSDDAPNTASHDLMRKARVGETLTHLELTGEDLHGAAATIEATASSAPVGVAFSIGGQLHVGAAASIGVVAAAPGHFDAALADQAVTLAAAATSVYDSPSWPSELDRAAASREISRGPRAPPVQGGAPFASGRGAMSLDDFPATATFDESDMLAPSGARDVTMSPVAMFRAGGAEAAGELDAPKPSGLRAELTAAFAPDSEVQFSTQPGVGSMRSDSDPDGLNVELEFEALPDEDVSEVVGAHASAINAPPATPSAFGTPTSAPRATLSEFHGSPPAVGEFHEPAKAGEFYAPKVSESRAAPAIATPQKPVAAELEADLKRELEAQVDLQRQLDEVAVQRQIDAQMAPATAVKAAIALPGGPVPTLRGHRPSTGTTTVVTTVGPNPRRAISTEQPSMVIAMDLASTEAPRPVSTPPAQAGSFAVNDADVHASASRADDVHANVFSGEGIASDSLIIDFEETSSPSAASPDPTNEKIRPAAKPVGRGFPAPRKRRP